MGFEKQAERKWRLKSKSPTLPQITRILILFCRRGTEAATHKKTGNAGNHKIPLLLQRAGIEAVNRY
jgi:hypothetical protein